MRILVLVICAIFSLAVLAGCTVESQTRLQRDVAQAQLVVSIVQDIVADLPQGPKRDSAVKNLAIAQDILAKAQTALAAWIAAHPALFPNTP